MCTNLQLSEFIFKTETILHSSMSNNAKALSSFMMRESWLKSSRAILWKQTCLQWSTLDFIFESWKIFALAKKTKFVDMSNGLEQQ